MGKLGPSKQKSDLMSESKELCLEGMVLDEYTVKKSRLLDYKPELHM